MYVAPQSVIIAQPSKRLPAIRPRPVSKLAKRLGRLDQVYTYSSGVTAAVSAPCAPFRCGDVEWLGRLPRPFIFQKTLWSNAHGIAWHGMARHGYDYGYGYGYGRHDVLVLCFVGNAERDREKRRRDDGSLYVRTHMGKEAMHPGSQVVVRSKTCKHWSWFVLIRCHIQYHVLCYIYR